jgi:SAM-dependent methyltransferase
LSEAYDPDNLLDRLSHRPTLELHYEHMRRREAELLSRRLALTTGDVLSVGCGWNPGRHLFPQPSWRMTGVELEEEKPRALVEQGTLEHGMAGQAGELPLADASFDAVLYRLVLHHIAYQGPLQPAFAEAARLLRPGGVLVAVEPGAWHRVGAGPTAANALGLGTALHGTPDDIPLSPHRLEREARAAGLAPELHAITYTWRRMPGALQRALWPLDRRLGSRPRAAPLGHTLMLIAHRPSSAPTAASNVRSSGAAAASTRERMSRLSGVAAGSPPASGKATAPPASRTISWAAAQSTERVGASVAAASKRPAATWQSESATDPRPRRRAAPVASSAAAWRATSRGCADSMPSTSIRPSRARGGSRAPSRKLPPPRRARHSSPCPRSSTNPSSTSPIVGPEATAIDSANAGMPRLALRDPSIGSITTWTSPPAPSATSPRSSEMT